MSGVGYSGTYVGRSINAFNAMLDTPMSNYQRNSVYLEGVKDVKEFNSNRVMDEDRFYKLVEKYANELERWHHQGSKYALYAYRVGVAYFGKFKPNYSKLMQTELCKTISEIFQKNAEKMFEMQKNIMDNQIKAYQENTKQLMNMQKQMLNFDEYKEDAEKLLDMGENNELLSQYQKTMFDNMQNMFMLESFNKNFEQLIEMQQKMFNIDMWKDYMNGITDIQSKMFGL